MSIGQLFPAGTGCIIEPGMKPGTVIPEDYGMKSYVLHGIDGIAQRVCRKVPIPVAGS